MKNAPYFLKVLFLKCKKIWHGIELYRLRQVFRNREKSILKYFPIANDDELAESYTEQLEKLKKGVDYILDYVPKEAVTICEGYEAVSKYFCNKVDEDKLPFENLLIRDMAKIRSVSLGNIAKILDKASNHIADSDCRHDRDFIEFEANLLFSSVVNLKIAERICKADKSTISNLSGLSH